VKVLVLTNASAARARRLLPALREALPPGPHLAHRITEQAAHTAALVGHDRWCPEDLLVVNGGDGSVQHVLTQLVAHCPVARRPRVACLPGGTTNMTSFDLNHHRRPAACIRTLAHAAREPGALVAPRAVVRVQDETGAARCGLFFGMGTIVQGIDYFHRRVRPSGGRHELGAGLALLRALWGIARAEPPFAEPVSATLRLRGAGADWCGLVRNRSGTCAGWPHGTLPGAGEQEIGGEPGADVAVRLLLVTTLGRLLLGLRPYWGSARRPLRATLVESEARSFLRHVPRLLAGRPSRGMGPEHGYHSGTVEGLTLSFTGSYTLDGELFANAGATIRICATHPIRFVSL
jgi:hypothetical protein